jgi:uncharacterized protein with PIN domain
MLVDGSVLMAILKGDPETAGFTAALAEAKASCGCSASCGLRSSPRWR